MARITIQDSLAQVDNHFQLIHMSAYRARQLANGARPLIDPGNSKPTVIALREIAAGFKPADFDKSIEDDRYGMEDQ